MRSQHRGYWCPGAKAPGHQYPQCWLNIHCIGPVSYKKYHTYGEQHYEIKLHFKKKWPSRLRVNWITWISNFIHWYVWDVNTNTCPHFNSTLATPLVMLTHPNASRMMHICIVNLTIIGSDNGSSPGRCQAIMWTYGEVLLIGPLGTNFSEILIETDRFSFKKMHLKMPSAKWLPFCLGLNVLRYGRISHCTI